MQLVTFTLDNYRRFRSATSVKLYSDMIAFVGPNEAGKSSILKALQHLNNDSPFSANELPRRSADRPTLKWQFQLEDSDRALLSELPEAAEVERVVVTKGPSGQRSWTFSPPMKRDTAPRSLALGFAFSISEVLERLSREFGVALDLPGMASLLQFDADLTPDQLNELRGHAQSLVDLLEVIPAAEISPADDQSVRSLIERLEYLAEDEASVHPDVLARQLLEPAVPQIRLFDVADRDLQKEYDLNEVADNPPAALKHLAELGELDLVALRDEITDGQVADASTRRNKTNEKLTEIFSTWKQESIALQVDFQGQYLHVQVTTPADKGLSSLDDRSDGMRWFATLLAFTHGAGAGPILLADEIETHLHYDAQADLVEVLSTQTLTSKVIYTTHSFGCLPNDLGNGVRAVEQVDVGTSRIRNGLWESGSGFSPLLVSMGAAAVTFTPTRMAVLGEGATEAILLPTILRQATGTRKLSFQVAPGLSSVASADVPYLENEAGSVAYLVDGDEGGRQIEQKLLASVPPERIVVLQDPVSSEPMETEDLVDPASYLAAVNAELKLWNPSAREMTNQYLPSRMRTKAVEEWCKAAGLSAPDKSAVAQRVVNESQSGPIFDVERGKYIAEVLGRLTEALSWRAQPPQDKVTASPKKT